MVCVLKNPSYKIIEKIRENYLLINNRIFQPEKKNIRNKTKHIDKPINGS